MAIYTQLSPIAIPGGRYSFSAKTLAVQRVITISFASKKPGASILTSKKPGIALTSKKPGITVEEGYC